MTDCFYLNTETVLIKSKNNGTNDNLLKEKRIAMQIWSKLI